MLCAVWLFGSLAHLVFDARTATPIINQVSPSILYMLRWLSMAGFFPAMLALRSGQFLCGAGGCFLGVVFDRPIFGVEDWLGQGTSACNQLHPSTLRSVLLAVALVALENLFSRFRALRASIRSSARQKRFGQSPTKFMHSSRIGISDVASISRAFPGHQFF